MRKDPKIRLMVVDDHFVVRIGLAESINTEVDMCVIAQASSGGQAIDLYRQNRPDVTLMDLRLPQVNGIEASAAICKEFPGARIIIFSTFDSDEDIYRAL